MNTLFRHIEFLLTHHDCVIVPGLGAFIVTSMPAVIDRVSRRATPPSRSVMFNQAVSLDDGLLANSYSRRLGLSFEEARQVILKDVATIFQILNSTGTFTAGSLGFFTLGEEGQAVFHPAFSSLETAERTGFYSVSLNRISTPEKDGLDSLTSNQSLLPYSVEETLTPKRYHHFRISRSFMRYAAIIALIIVVALAVFIYPVPHDTREHRASVVPVEALIPVSQPKEEKPTISEPVTLSNNIVHSVRTTPETSVPQKEYYLIVATFHSKKDAQRFVEIHSSSEFPLNTVSSRKVTRVYAASSPDKKELLSQLNSSKISANFPNAWIWSSND